MRVCKVRITKATEPTRWYADLVGEEFEAYIERLSSHDDYVLTEDYDRPGSDFWRHIDIADCVEVEDTEEGES